MKVTILNPEVLENLYENHGKFACVCYGTDESKAKGVGKHCEKNGHMSGSRCEYIKFKIEGIDRGTAEQALRHEVGVHVPYDMMDNYNFTDWMDRVYNINPDEIVKNMASFRYIDKTGFNFITPSQILKNSQARLLYEYVMSVIGMYREEIIKQLVAGGASEKEANEEANFLLPRATATDFVIGLTPEALIRFCHKRLCVRAQEQIRKLAKLMKEEVEKLNPQFAEELVPHCVHLLWCPEGKQSCGRYPSREQLSALVNMKK